MGIPLAAAGEIVIADAAAAEDLGHGPGMAEKIGLPADDGTAAEAAADEPVGQEKLADERFARGHVLVGLDPHRRRNFPGSSGGMPPDSFEQVGPVFFDGLVDRRLALRKPEVRMGVEKTDHRGGVAQADGPGLVPGPEPVHVEMGMADEMDGKGPGLGQNGFENAADPVERGSESGFVAAGVGIDIQDRFGLVDQRLQRAFPSNFKTDHGLGQTDLRREPLRPDMADLDIPEIFPTDGLNDILFEGQPEPACRRLGFAALVKGVNRPPIPSDADVPETGDIYSGRRSDDGDFDTGRDFAGQSGEIHDPAVPGVPGVIEIGQRMGRQAVLVRDHGFAESPPRGEVDVDARLAQGGRGVDIDLVFKTVALANDINVV